jgi:hypothetical protein
MTQGDLVLAWQQHQEYIANQKFESEPGFIQEPIECRDAYVSEEERWEELCQQQKSPPRSY